MFDSTVAADVPAGSDLVMGYVDGSSAWSDADWQRFAGRTLVRICIFSDRYDAQVIDLEPGNNDARGAVPWIREKWLRDETPTVYCFSDAGPRGYRISDVREECDAAGLRHPLFLITDFDGRPDLFDPAGDPSIIGKQFANSKLTGGHYDASVVADHWPGVDREAAVQHPIYLGESVAVIVVNPLDTDPEKRVARMSAIFRWPDGRERTIERKAYGKATGMHPYVIYPPADPDFDVTEDLDAQPGVFIVVVSSL